jgi:hypothetical protein
MPKYVFAYHGGSSPASPEEYKQVMERWTAWFGKIGPSLADAGSPVGKSTTVSKSGVKNDGGANPISGYSFVNAANIEDAVKLAKGCPILDAGGSVEIAEAMGM